jgi:hypothetical protein
MQRTSGLVIRSLLGAFIGLSSQGCVCFDMCGGIFAGVNRRTALDSETDTLLAAGRYEECIAAFGKAETKLYERDQLKLAACREGAGDLDGATKIYERLIAADPDEKKSYSEAATAKQRLATLRRSTSGAAPRQSRWPALSMPSAHVGGGENDAAVIVGVTDYFALPKIPGAADTATDWYTHLTTALGVDPAHITLLRNGEATRESVSDALRRAAKDVDGGRVWFVFIGHGAPALNGQDGLLLGADTQASERSIEARGIPQREVLDVLSGSRNAGVVAVFDACFSGTAPDGATPLVAGSQATLPVRKATPVANQVSFSSSEKIAGPLPFGDRPAYSYLVLGALRGWADKDRDGVITADEVHRYTSTVLTTAVRDRDQTPRLVGAEAMTVARTTAEQGPDIAGIVAGVQAN